MLHAANIQRGKSGPSNQFAKPLLKNPVNPYNTNKNGTQSRPAAPWNVPNIYQPPALRSYAVIPPHSGLRQVIMPKQATSEQGSQSSRQQVQQSAQTTQQSQQKPTQQVPAQKLPTGLQKPQVSIQLPGQHHGTIQGGRPSKPTVPLLSIVR